MINIASPLFSLIENGPWVPYPTIPMDYKSVTPSIPFLKVNIVNGPATRELYSKENKKNINGLIIIQIITEAGKGQLSPIVIVSELDDILQERILSNTTRLGLSSFQNIGVDPSDSTKLISEYSIPYTYYGD